MTGAMELKPGFLGEEILINLDSEDEGELFIGCAGGIGILAEFKCEAQDALRISYGYMSPYQASRVVTPGGEIHCGLGNANKILTPLPLCPEKNVCWSLSEIGGGNLHNYPPRSSCPRRGEGCRQS